ncbi:MAG: asparagine synthase (glutamine-hydrolyzing) [Calditrichaceae bacterium]
MCGICGIIENGKDNRQLITDMCDMMAHRGPDNSGYYNNGAVTLGHRRLSIIDLNTGDQPIFNEDKSVVIVFNGEIYNFQSIKDRLIEKGHKFLTTSDTETLVHCYEEYGLDFIKDLNGIFAFALYDVKKKRLILVRDHFGVKPLHYWRKDNKFIFSSEQKSILLHPDVKRGINYDALHSQINLRYTQGDETLFKDIFRVPPAHFLIYENNKISIKPYYTLPMNPDYGLSERDVIESIHSHLREAIRKQLLSDVPIGVYLSGGMDSSAIVAMMHELNVPEINTFTLGFNEDTDEFPDAEKIAKHFDTNHYTTSLAFDPLRQFPEVIWHAEEPKINLLQGFNMSRFVSPEYKVILGGLGGDELFIGYDIYKYINSAGALLKKLSPGFQKTFLEPFSQLLFMLQNKSGTLRFDEYRRGLQMLLSTGNLQKFYLIIRNVWEYDSGFYHEIYQPDFLSTKLKPVHQYFDQLFAPNGNLSPIDRVAYAEFHSKMVNDYLLVDDRMSMAHSVELRVPFLDKDLVEFMYTVPGEMKIRRNVTKHLFREAMRSRLPDEILQKKKWGFTVNPYLQFKKDLKLIAEKILTKEFIDEQGIFNYAYLRRIMDYPPHPRLRWHYNYLWIVLGIAIWEKMFIQSDKFKDKAFDLETYYL